MIIIHLISILAQILQVLGNENLLFLGRFISGMVSGFNTGTFPIYNKEMSPSEL